MNSTFNRNVAWTAVWFAATVLNIIDCVFDRVNGARGFGPLWNVAVLGLTSYFLFDGLRNLFGGTDDV